MQFLAEVQLLRILGSGYFGEVWEGMDPVRGQVAVKIFKKRPDESDEVWLNRKVSLLKEGQRLKDSEHDRVVRIFQLIEAEDKNLVGLVMEYCSGGSFQNYFDTGPMQLAPLRNLLTDAALGLQAIHARDMLHRDLKPANILLDENGRAKIADFGLATNDIFLGYSSAAGYSDHLAIEAHISGITSIRTDIWAFGMTAYRMLHGKLFYEELVSPRYLIPQGKFASKLPWLPHIPNSWRRFIRKAMHDDSYMRYQTATDLLNGIRRLDVEPDWECHYTSGDVMWKRATKDREIQVTWSCPSSRKNSWNAVSIPIVAGRMRTLGSSGDEPIGKIEAQKQLNKFFTKQAKRNPRA